MSEHRLIDERDFLLKSIADLDAELAAGDIAEEDYRTLRDDYTARAAAVLRELDAGSAPQPEAAMTPAPPPRSRARLAILGLAGVALSVAAGWALSSAMGERLPGDQATGSIVETPVDPLTRAQQLVADGKLVEAVKLYDEVLADKPSGRTKAIALAQRGWLISRAAKADPTLADKGLAQIDEAIAADPDYPEAYFFKGMLLAREKDDPVGAAVAFRTFLSMEPPPELATFVEGELRSALALAEARGLTVPPVPGIPSAEAPHP